MDTITNGGGGGNHKGNSSKFARLPQKKYFRQRAHSNPISDHDIEYPVCPSEVDWAEMYPLVKNDKSLKVVNLDVGCGYGGLLLALSQIFPEQLSLGMEIRVKVSDYVKQRIEALRQSDSKYNNIACIRTNAMKYLPNYFEMGQLENMFFLFPDPHFKNSKHKWRIISETLLAEYAYILKIGGFIYTVTDVKEYHEWVLKCFSNSDLFDPIHELESPELVNLPCYKAAMSTTEEGNKVMRAKGEMYAKVFIRIDEKSLTIEEKNELIKKQLSIQSTPS